MEILTGSDLLYKLPKFLKFHECNWNLNHKIHPFAQQARSNEIHIICIFQ